MKEVKLKKIADHISRGISPKYADDTGLRVVNQKCIRDGRVKLELAREYSSLQTVNSNKLVKPDDILVNSTGVGTLGRSAIIQATEKGLTVDSHVTIFRVNKEKADPRYLSYVFRLLEPIFENLSGGATGQTELSKKDVGGVKIFLPSLPIQSRIADILSAYDELIDVNNKRIAILEQMAEQIYKEWFVRMRFPGHENSKFVKGIPEGWEVKPLKDLATLITKGTTPTTHGKSFVEQGINFIKAESFNDSGHYIPSKFAFIDESTHQMLKRSQLQQDDVLITIAGVLGRTTIVRDSILPANTNQAVGIIRLKDGGLSPWLIRFFLSRPHMREYVNIVNGQAAQPNINLTQVGQLKVLVPDKSITESIEQILTPIREEVQILINQNEHLKSSKGLLLPRLIGGKIQIESHEELPV